MGLGSWFLEFPAIDFFTKFELLVDSIFLMVPIVPRARGDVILYFLGYSFDCWSDGIELVDYLFLFLIYPKRPGFASYCFETSLDYSVFIRSGFWLDELSEGLTSIGVGFELWLPCGMIDFLSSLILELRFRELFEALRGFVGGKDFA